MTSPILVFDLDGTLVDTADDLVATLNVVLEEAGLGGVTGAQTRAMVGHGARVLIERALAAKGAERAPDEVDALLARYIKHYGANIAVASRPFPGVEAALDRFSARGFALAVCTNKLEHLSLRLLDALGLSPRFAAICGADTFAVRKPDPLMLTETIRRAGGDAARAVMIGDSATDIDTARAAGIPVVAVDFGYTPVPVTELSPDVVISHYDALDDAVAKVLA
ncbi:phosphoglycolate phosphatase [Prosthecomicrobium pneumaticum]|uniref:Phosphoglycolate phosphatase n=1 Tax=Prosthecomicrobium pneumaticum TaxID=81895 RepID=A0A7W9CT62_9HYPH|nr:phosphoglycolate phosphatase [Prosthecomicrobium pneumaticum]MBB5751071.1 phosphoglycolate phosphatase [Prosthecomicrobium pneumaticum]